MMTRGGGANSDGGQEVEMENKSTEETVQLSPYCAGLELVSACHKAS